MQSDTMESSLKANTSEEDLYGDIDDMYVSQSDGETMQTSEGTFLSTSLSAVDTASKDDTDYNMSDTEADIGNDLDLYDDLIVEEGQQRIESFQEIIKKYEEAMNLTNQLEAENRALRELIHKKDSNTHDMQKNFSSLLITAKGELTRKDRELDNLRKRMSSSPGSYKYNITRKSARETPAQASDCDPPFMSSPGRQRTGKGIETSPKKYLKNTDSVSRRNKNPQDIRKKHDDDIDRSSKSHSKDRTKKYTETCKDSSSLERQIPRKKEKYDNACVSRSKGSKGSELNNEPIVKGGVSVKSTEHEKECERNRDKSRNERHIEKERKKEPKQSGENISENRRQVDEQIILKNRDKDTCKISGTTDFGKASKQIDLREKLRLKKLGNQSGNNTETRGSHFKSNSLEHSLSNISDRDTHERGPVFKLKRLEDQSTSQDRGNIIKLKNVEDTLASQNVQGRENVIKLKKVENVSSSHESPCFSIFQSKNNNRIKSGEKRKEPDLSAEKAFLEKLKISIKKNESKTSNNATNITCSDKRTSTATTLKTQSYSTREIRSYSDISHEISDAESFTDTDRAASSENYFSASEVPCYETTQKTPFSSEVQKTSSDTSGTISNPNVDTESVKQFENISNKEETFSNDCDNMEVDTNYIEENSDIYSKTNSILKEMNNLKPDSCIYATKKEVSAVKQGGEEESEIDEGVETLQNISHSQTEMKIHEKCLDCEVQNDDAEVNGSTKMKESPGILRRSARLSSKSESSVSLCKTNIDNENIQRMDTKTKRKSNDNETVNNTENVDEIKDKNTPSERDMSGNISCVASKLKKGRIRRSVTSETISSVTSVYTSESASDVSNSINEETENSSLSTESTSTSDDVHQSEKSEKLQKKMCTNKNCTIRMRHLHPKCSEPNSGADGLQKESQDFTTDSEKTCHHEELHKNIEGLATDRNEEMKEDSTETVNSQILNVKSMDLEFVNDKGIQQVSSGTLELAREESIGCSSASSISDYISEGSTLSSDSSGSESSSESSSYYLDQDKDVTEVREDREGVKKSPKQSTEKTNRSSEFSNKCSVQSDSSSLNNMKIIKMEVVKTHNFSATLLNDKKKESVVEQNVQFALDTSVSIQNSITTGKSQGDKVNEEQPIVDHMLENSVKKSYILSTKQKEEDKGKSNESSKSGRESIDLDNDTLCFENNGRSNAGTEHLAAEDKEGSSNEIDCTVLSKDNSRMEIVAATDNIECHEPVKSKTVKEGRDWQSENVVSLRKYTVVSNDSSIAEDAMFKGQTDKCDRSSNSSSIQCDISNVEENVEKINELNTHTNRDIKTNGRRETVSKNETSETESEGSFGSNIMSERTVSSMSDDESDLSDSDDSTDSSYTGESSYSSSDESGTGSSLESYSSDSDSEYDHDAQSHTGVTTDNSAKNRQVNADTICGEKKVAKEVSISLREKFPSVSSCSEDKQNKESVGKSQQKDDTKSLNENSMEVDEIIDHEQNSIPIDSGSKQKNFKNVSDDSIVDVKAKCDKNVSLLLQEQACAVINASKNLSPDRSHLLQTLLKCVQFELNSKEAVPENSVGEVKYREAVLSDMSKETGFVNTDNSVQVIEVKKGKEMTSLSENNFLHENKIAEKSVENAANVAQLENTEFIEIDKENEKDANIFRSTSLSSALLGVGVNVSENPRINGLSNASSSEQVVIGSEKAETNEKNEPCQETQSISKKDRTENRNIGSYENSIDNTDKVSNSSDREVGQDLHIESKEIVFGTTSSFSDASDSEDSSSGSNSHSSDCSTCTSGTGSSAESDSDTDNFGKSEEECSEKRGSFTDKNIDNQENPDDEEVGKNTVEDMTVQHDMPELRDGSVKCQEIEKDLYSRNEQVIGEVYNASDVTLNLKPCEDNPYWIADEIPVFLKETDNCENQSKKLSSSKSTASKDSVPLTPAVKFINLNVSPTKSPDETQNLSPDKEAGVNSQPASGGPSLGVISSLINKVKCNQEKSKLKESGKAKNAKGKGKKQLSKRGNSVDINNLNNLGSKLKSNNSTQENTLVASRNLKKSMTYASAKLKKTTEHNENIENNHSCKPINQTEEKEPNINSKGSLNSRKEGSKRQNRDINVQEAKSKQPEACPLRRSPRKKPSQSSVTDTKSKSNVERTKINVNILEVSKSNKTATSKTEEYESLKLKVIKSSNNKRDLQSVEKATHKSKSLVDVTKGEVNSNNKRDLKSVEKATYNSKSLVDVTKGEENAKQNYLDSSTRYTSEAKLRKLEVDANSKKESKVRSKFPTKKIIECVPVENNKNTSTTMSTGNKINAKEELSNSKHFSDDRNSGFEKRHTTILDTTRVLSDKIMKLKVEKNMLEKQLAEKQRKEKNALKMKIAIPKKEVKSIKCTKENMMKSDVTMPGSSRSGKMKPLTVALTVNGSENSKSRNDTTRTGSLNKQEHLTFEEKLSGCEEYISKSQSANKLPKRRHKDLSLSLTTQTASLKTFTIPKLTVGKKCHNKVKNDERVTKCKSESLMQRNTNYSLENTKGKRFNETRTSYSEEKKANISKSANKKYNSVKKYVVSSDSESSVSNKSSGNDSDSSGEDSDALVKAVFGSSDTSGNSGKSLTFDDLCKTRSSEDTDDVVKDSSVDDMMNSDSCRESDGIEAKLSKEKIETTKLKVTNFQTHSKCSYQTLETRNEKYLHDSKCCDMLGRKSKNCVKYSKSINGKKDNFQSKENVIVTCFGDENSTRNGEQKERCKSANGNQGLRKSPRIKAVKSPKRDFSNKNESADSKCKEPVSKELRRSNRTPRKYDQEKCQRINEVRYFEISDKNPVLNKIVSPKKPKHQVQPYPEDHSGKSKSNLVCKSNKFENLKRKETKGVPILLLEESTIDGIDYHDDVTLDLEIVNHTVEAEAKESEESKEEELNEKEIALKEQSDSDQSVEEGEISKSEEEKATDKFEQGDLEGTSQKCNEMTPTKLKKCVNKGRLSPVKFPISSNRLSSDRESSCQCRDSICIHKRLGISDKKQKKRYRSDTDSCSDTSFFRPKRRMRHEHSSIRKRSRSSDRTDSPGNRRHGKSDKLLEYKHRRSVSPRRRIKRSISKSPHRCRQRTRSRSASPHRGRRRRSRSYSPVRSRLAEKESRAARSRHRYKGESDARSPRQCRGNRSNSRETSSVDRSDPSKNRRSHKKSVRETAAEISFNRSNNKKSRLKREDRETSEENSRRKTIREKSLSNASTSYDESSDEENERFSKLKSEKRRNFQKEMKTSENYPRSRGRLLRNRDRDHTNFTSGRRRRSRSRSLNHKRKRYISESGSEIESDTEKRIDKRLYESNCSGNNSHKRARTDKSIKENIHEKKEKSKKR